MRAPVLLLAILAPVTAGCATPYWSRPGAQLPQLAEEARACYRAAVELESPAALARAEGALPLLPRSEPPPRLWARAPGEASLERHDQQLRYERCMRERGWRAVRTRPPDA